jgi:hypothetical protein
MVSEAAAWLRGVVEGACGAAPRDERRARWQQLQVPEELFCRRDATVARRT